MAGQIIDLAVILPDDDSIVFTGRTDGVKYNVRLFIPFAVSLLVMHHSVEIQEMFKSDGIKAAKKSIEFLYRIFEIICIRQYPFMDQEWIKKNLAIPKMLDVTRRILATVYKYFETELSEDDGEAKGQSKDLEIAPIMARLMNHFSLTPDYILYEMTFPQVFMFYEEAIALETGKRKPRKAPEETEEEIRAKFKKKPGGGYA